MSENLPNSQEKEDNKNKDKINEVTASNINEMCQLIYYDFSIK